MCLLSYMHKTVYLPTGQSLKHRKQKFPFESPFPISTPKSHFSRIGTVQVYSQSWESNRKLHMLGASLLTTELVFRGLQMDTNLI